MSKNANIQTTDFMTRTQKFVYDDPRDFSFEDYISMGRILGEFWSTELLGIAAVKDHFEKFLDREEYDAFDMVSVAYALMSGISGNEQANQSELVELYKEMLKRTEEHVKENFNESDICFFEHSVYDNI